eukprot:6720990-Prymnesium_polylepis.2
MYRNRRVAMAGVVQAAAGKAEELSILVAEVVKVEGAAEGVTPSSTTPGRATLQSRRTLLLHSLAVATAACTLQRICPFGGSSHRQLGNSFVVPTCTAGMCSCSDWGRLGPAVAREAEEATVEGFLGDHRCLCKSGTSGSCMCTSCTIRRRWAECTSDQPVPWPTASATEGGRAWSGVVALSQHGARRASCCRLGSCSRRVGAGCGLGPAATCPQGTARLVSRSTQTRTAAARPAVRSARMATRDAPCTPSRHVQHIAERAALHNAPLQRSHRPRFERRIFQVSIFAVVTRTSRCMCSRSPIAITPSLIMLLKLSLLVAVSELSLRTPTRSAVSSSESCLASLRCVCC